MKLTELEQIIIDRLEPLSDSDLRVYGYPDNPQDLKRPTGNRVLVGWRRETLSAPQTLNPNAPIIQNRNIDFEVVVQVRDVRSHQRAIELVDRIRDLLTGFCPDNRKPLYEASGGFGDHIDNYWTYSMSFVLPTAYVKKPER